ncbi:MAG: late competence development ComFB family protein [Deltaproteobacteria bacterium]|nr:late competence development ComFB family protein [Deltaproteobacteria bacterium]
MAKPTKEDYFINDCDLSHIRNRNELRVIRLLRKQLPEEKDFCGCRICVEDVYAATLNTIPPQYAQTGSILMEHKPSDDEILRVLHQAIARVKHNPTHP